MAPHAQAAPGKNFVDGGKGIFAALGNFVLPLMIGAKDVAFPRLNLASYYVYVFGALMAVSSIVIGAVDTGWTFYTPYSTTTGDLYYDAAGSAAGSTKLLIADLTNKPHLTAASMFFTS